MISAQFDPVQPEPGGVPATPPQRPPQRLRRLGLVLALALALTGSAAGGGVARVLAATHWLPSQRPTVAVPVTIAQPVVAQSATASSVAGAVFSIAGPAVVRVTVAGPARGGSTPSGNGSGFVVDPRGLILTNYHVVATAQAVSMRFSGGEAREAQVLGTDRGNDLPSLESICRPVSPPRAWAIPSRCR